MKQGREGNPWQVVTKPVLALVIPEGNRLRVAVGLQEPLPNREARQQGYLSANCLSFVCVLVGILIFRHFGLPCARTLLGSGERPQAERGGLPSRQPSELEVKAEGVWVGCRQHPSRGAIFG